MSKFQDQVSKPRTSKAHKFYLDGGRKDLTKYSSSYTNPRSVDKSNAFLAKEENLENSNEEIDEEIDEASAAAAVAGHIGQPKKKKNKEVVEMQSREEIVEEIKVRSLISRMLHAQKIKMIKESIKNLERSFRLRNFIAGLISESDVEKNPHSSTGINKLSVLLKKIVPTLEDSYKTLTTDKSQRDSFRSHILNAVENTLRPEDAKELADADDTPQDLEEVEINIKDSDPLGASDEDKFIDISDAEGGDKEEEEDPLDSFGIEGEDLTGRDEAFEAFNQIENQIIDAYGVLQNPKDREIFYDYLLTNIKMYFDKFEDELAGVVAEPESDSYEKKDQEAEEEAPLPEI